MKYINNVHINTVQAVNMIMKFPGSKMCFLEQIATKYLKNLKDVEISLAYGFFKYLDITQITRGEDLFNTDILKVIDIYNRILERETDDWFVHMLKILLFSKLPQEMTCESEKIATLNWILQAQKEVSKKEPYFILPYIFYAEYWQEKNELGLALKYLEEGLKEAPQRAISLPAINPHLFFPVKEFYYRLCYSEQFDFANTLKKVSSIYFPSESTKLYLVENLMGKVPGGF